MQSDFASIQYHVRAGAAWITLHRPREMNAINLDLLAELASSLALAEADAAVRAVVITAGGDKAFCAGADLKQVLEPQDHSCLAAAGQDHWFRRSKFRKSPRRNFGLSSQKIGACT